MECTQCGQIADTVRFELIRDQHGRLFDPAARPSAAVCNGGCLSRLIQEVGMKNIPRALEEVKSATVFGYRFFASTQYIEEEYALAYLPHVRKVLLQAAELRVLHE